MLITKGSKAHPGGHHCLHSCGTPKQAVNSTMQVELSPITADQNKATEKTKAADNQFLDYAAKNPSAITQFHKSNMQLLIHSDASQLSE
jgi:hypothetical protein